MAAALGFVCGREWASGMEGGGRSRPPEAPWAGGGRASLASPLAAYRAGRPVRARYLGNPPGGRGSRNTGRASIATEIPASRSEASSDGSSSRR
jgi:hypothetical protein